MTRYRILFTTYTILTVLYSVTALAKPNLQAAPRTAEEKQNIRVYRQTSDAVVFISTISLSVDPFELLSGGSPKEGAGTGIVINAEKGIVVTNLHVIQNADQISILLSNGQQSSAKLLGFDEKYDLAVLQLRDLDMPLISIPFGDSSSLLVGQRVLAIGNPFGLDRTLTTGIISSLNRTVKTPGGKLMRDLIQTDAAINPGNSGGPLLDTAGRLIGINTAILSRSGDSAGIGFAIPINKIQKILPELIATGRVLRPELGWILVDTSQGPMVRRVLAGSPAEQAGVIPAEKSVRRGYSRYLIRNFSQADLVFRVNGTLVRSRDQVEDIISESKRGEKVRITLRRGGLNGRERSVQIDPILQ